MISDQDFRGSLPPTTATVFTNQLNRQRPSSPKPTSQESELAAIIDRAIINIRDAVTAATVDTHIPIRPTRNPLRRTVSDTITPPATGARKISPYLNSRNTVLESLNREDGPQIKRLKKMEEMVIEIEQRCRDLRREYVKQENIGDDNPSSKAIMAPNEGGEECVGFKRLDEDEEECIGFNRLDDGALRIQMRCSCRKHFEILHNDIGCFYRLI